MTEVEYEEDVLTVRGKNKAARIALAGPDHGSGDVVVSRADIASAKFVPTRLAGSVNGNLIITTTQGERYQLHFRKKQQSDFENLARTLGAVGIK